MVRIEYNARLLLDFHFFKWLDSLEDKVLQRRIKRNLMYIKASSLDHKRKHTVILQNHFDKIISEKLLDKVILSGLVKSFNEPEFLNGYDEVTQIVKFGIDLAKDKPFKTIILTSPYFEEKYTSNKHFSAIKSIVVKSNTQAIDLLDVYFSDFSKKKDINM